MSQSTNILIQRLAVELEMSGDPTLTPQAWQQHSSQLVQQHVLRPLEEVLVKMAPSDGRTLRIDRLELDLGELRSDDLAWQLPQRLAEAMQKALAEVRMDDTAADQQAINSEERHWEAFIFFLKNGSLPWWYQAPAEQWEAELYRAFPLREKTKAELLRTLSGSKARRRLARQFSEKFLREMTQVVFPRHFGEVQEVLAFFEKILQKTTTPPLPDTELWERLWEVVFAWLSGPSGPAGLGSFVFQKSLPHLPEAHTAEFFEKLKIQVERAPRLPKAAVALLDGLTSQPAETPTSTAPDTDGHYVRNAGLVILHPFLPQLFEELGLSRRGELLQPEQAVHLLQFLAAGQTNMPEHELTLNKLLCGLPLDWPLRRQVRLTKKEKIESGQVLRAVLRHWSALSNTSEEGLQGTYLCRPGKLTQRPTGEWRLQVEQRAYDILLSQLPWSISRVQLPWMPQPLWIEW